MTAVPPHTHSASRYHKVVLLLAIAATKILAAPVLTDASSALGNPASTRQTEHLTYGVLGDSWASGVAYSANNQYDENSAGCMRTTQAYAVQMKNNPHWANGNQNLQFPACSGSKLGDIINQLSQLTDPNIVIMTIGGNDANFGNIASNCIYQQSNKTYGPEYTDDTERVGLCAKAIDASKLYITGTGGPGTLSFDLDRIIKAMLTSPQVLLNPDFRIYQTGYAHFFNLADDWCNTESFGAISGGSNKPKLSHQLRADINGLTDQLIAKIKAITLSFSAQNVGYVSVTEAFDGHRFCEAGSSHIGQYYSNNVWFWNLSYPLLVANATNPNPSTVVELDGPLFADSDRGTVADGWKHRPFRPKEAGHQAIMQSIIAQLRADKVPEVN